jgi:geranylgeranyl pyrophosphate synthase
MGRCFQLRDDYLDLFGQESVTGKKLGGDIGNSKLTYPVLCSMAHQKGSEFLSIWNQNPESGQARIDQCLKWMHKNEIPKICIELIDKEIKNGLTLLAGLEGNEETKIRIESLCRQLAYRDK